MNYYEHIESYCEGQMESSDKSDFETAIKQDSQLSAHVDQYHASKLLSEGLMEIDIMETITGLQENKRENNLSEHKSKTKILSLKKLMMAASFIGLLGFSMWFINTNYGDQSIIDDFYFEPSLLEERGGDITEEISQVNNLWNDKSYENLIQFVNGKDKVESNDYLFFLQAYSYYHIQKFDQAKVLLSDMIFDNNIQYKNQTEWLMILIDIDQKQYSKAEQKLNHIISDNNHLFYKQAIEVKQKINSNWRVVL